MIESYFVFKLVSGEEIVSVTEIDESGIEPSFILKSLLKANFPSTLSTKMLSVWSCLSGAFFSSNKGMVITIVAFLLHFWENHLIDVARPRDIFGRNRV